MDYTKHWMDMPTWDTLYKNLIHDNQDGLWVDPHERLVEFFDNPVSPPPSKRILDLGCGTGRHQVFLEERGHEVFGMDVSANGLIYARDWLRKKDHPARLLLANMTSLPYCSSSFDIIISMYVIHHNPLVEVRRTIQEMFRLLLPGGLILLTIPSKRGFRHDRGQQVEPGTVIPDIGQDRGIPHHYFDLAEIASEFTDFVIREIRLDEEVNDDGYLSSHWFIRAEKPGESGR
jgi:SAM-dependent methyltransferase